MERDVSDPVAVAIEQISAGLDVLLAEEWVPAGPDEAAARIREVERLSRRFHAVQVGVVSAVDRSGVFRADGHASAKVMVRHCANLSNAQALRRAQVAAALGDMPEAAAAHATGRLGVAQVERIGRVHANRRVRDQLVGEDAAVTRAAVVLPFRQFDAAMGDWERLADEDGAGDRAERADANRDFRMPRNTDGSGRFDGGGGALAVQEIEDVWQRQVEREWAADWADARCRLGDAATKDDLARTDAQRRFDAMRTCFLRGDLAEYGVQARTCTELVLDEVTFERHLAMLFGADPGPDPRLATWWDDLNRTLDDLDPAGAASSGDEGTDATNGVGSDVAEDGGGRGDSDVPAVSGDDVSETDSDGDELRGTEEGSEDVVPRPGTPGGLVGFRCGTVDGRPLDPAEAVVATLIGHVRRNVTRADGVVVDMSRKNRFFTGARQLAVRLSSRSCVWTACDVPSSECQCDHLDAFNGPEQGHTNPDNGGPACGRHNRLKQQGYTVVRDRYGRYHVYRPDGTEIT
ncbi:MAG: DUF222 domain-containing protein [Aquihabitans sp.]